MNNKTKKILYYVAAGLIIAAGAMAVALGVNRTPGSDTDFDPESIEQVVDTVTVDTLVTE